MHVLPGQATTEQIAEWKEKNPNGVHAVTIKGDKNGPAVGIIYLKEPDDMDYSMIMSLLTDKKIPAAGEAALKALYIGGMPIDTNDKKLYRTMCTAAVGRVEFYETEAVKL